MYIPCYIPLYIFPCISHVISSSLIGMWLVVIFITIKTYDPEPLHFRSDTSPPPTNVLKCKKSCITSLLFSGEDLVVKKIMPGSEKCYPTLTVPPLQKSHVSGNNISPIYWTNASYCH